MATRSRGELKLLARTLLKSPVITKSFKGFTLAYLYIVLPRFLSIVTRAIKKKHGVVETVERLIRAVRNGLLPDRFPAFIAKLIGGVFLLDPLFSRLLGKNASMFAASFTSGLLAFRAYKSSLIKAGKGDTSDLSLTVFVRALDLIVRLLCRRSNVSDRALRIGDVLLMEVSSFAIMYAWFYYPHKLPRAYQKWITMAANMDDELVDALRYLKTGEIIYGKRGEHDDILSNMCIKAGMDPVAGRFSETVPLPCKLVHMGIDGCERHAAYRWIRGFTTGMSIYLPINVLVGLISGGRGRKGLRGIIVPSCRSSAFLATFIMLNWYGVCLVRTRIGPKLFPKATPQQLDDTYLVATGTALCGLSSLIEFPQRRGELALFVAPRALSIAIPQKQHDTHRSIEALLFALSFAALVTGVRNNRSDARGFFRRLMTAIF